MSDRNERIIGRAIDVAADDLRVDPDVFLDKLLGDLDSDVIKAVPAMYMADVHIAILTSRKIIIGSQRYRSKVFFVANVERATFSFGGCSMYFKEGGSETFVRYEGNRNYDGWHDIEDFVSELRSLL